MKNYGMTDYQIKKAYDKLRFNREYMQTNGIQLDGKVVPFASFVANSYTNAHRYVAELQHRAWSIYEYAEERKLKNIFITLTLPSKWHPKKTINRKLVNNPKFGGRKFLSNKYTLINGVRYKFLNCDIRFKCYDGSFKSYFYFGNSVDKYTPRNASKELSKMFSRLLKDRSYTSIDKDERCYFRVTEPHKDGTPHLHISLFVPEDKVERIVKALKRLYPAPLGKIETDVKSPVKYLMKYVLKTLDDLRDEKSDISNLTLWYLYHGISRFYTSRTFVVLEVYRKLNGMYSLRELTKDYRSQDVSVYLDTTTRKIASIENEHGTIYTPKPVNWLEKLEAKDRLGVVIFNFVYDGVRIPKSFTLKQRFIFKASLSDFKSALLLDSGFESIYEEPAWTPPVYVIIDGERHIYVGIDIRDESNFFVFNFLYDGVHTSKSFTLKQNFLFVSSLKKVVKPKKMPYQMTDFELYNYFNNLDIDLVDDKHYMKTRNLLIERGYLDEDVLPLDAMEYIDYYFETEGAF